MIWNQVHYRLTGDAGQNLMGQRLREAIASHGDAFYIIYSDGEQTYVDADLDYFGITRRKDDCSLIESKGPLLTICRAERR